LESKTYSKNFNQHKLDENELLSIVLYAWDLKMNGEDYENFYFILNNVLRERSNENLKKWRGYLFYFQSALSKLPKIKTTVFRGVKNNTQFIVENYSEGRKIHWSAYASTSNLLETEKSFAHEDGVILMIKIQDGRSICEYSPTNQKSY